MPLPAGQGQASSDSVDAGSGRRRGAFAVRPAVALTSGAREGASGTRSASVRRAAIVRDASHAQVVGRGRGALPPDVEERASGGTAARRRESGDCDGGQRGSERDRKNYLAFSSGATPFGFGECGPSLDDERAFHPFVTGTAVEVAEEAERAGLFRADAHPRLGAGDDVGAYAEVGDVEAVVDVASTSSSRTTGTPWCRVIWFGV